MRRFIMDCDTGGDDAAAITLAVASKDIQLLGVSACMGNLPLSQTYRNARELLRFLEVDYAPVAKGSENPLVRQRWVGSEEEHFLPVEGLTRDMIPEIELPAVEWMAKTLRESEEKITLIPLAPLTNIAKLMFAYPDLVKEKVDEIIIMGGGMHFGNTTGAAELNIYADPEAAQAVFSFGVPVAMCGLDVCYKAYITSAENEEIRAIGNKASDVMAGVTGQALWWASNGGATADQAIVYDTVPVIYALHPELFKVLDSSIEVECGSELCDGATICDPREGARRWSKAPRIHKVVLDVDRQGYIDAVKRILGEYQG